MSSSSSNSSFASAFSTLPISYSSTLYSSATYAPSSCPTSSPSSSPPSSLSSSSSYATTMDKIPEERSRLLVRTLGCVLQKLVDVNRKLDPADSSSGSAAAGGAPSASAAVASALTKFHASRPPSISVAEYLERINTYASCSSECLVLALIYIDRLIQQSNFALTALNIHRVLITAIMLAAKFFDDQYFNNLYYAKVGGVPCKEINSLEVEFLFLTNFSLHVTEEVFFRYFHELMNHAAHAQCPSCCRRGSAAATAAAATTTVAAAGSGVGGLGRVPSPVYQQQGGDGRGRGIWGGGSVSPGMVVTPPLSYYNQHQQQLHQQQQQQQLLHQQLFHQQQQHVLQQQRRVALAGGNMLMGVEQEQQQLQDEQQFMSYFSYEGVAATAVLPASSSCPPVASVSSTTPENPQAAHSYPHPHSHHHQQQQQQHHHRLLYAPVPLLRKPPPSLAPDAPTYYPHAAGACPASTPTPCLTTIAVYSASEVESKGGGASTFRGERNGSACGISSTSSTASVAAAAAAVRQQQQLQQQQLTYQQPPHYHVIGQQQQQYRSSGAVLGGGRGGVGLSSRAASLCAQSYLHGFQVLMHS